MKAKWPMIVLSVDIHAPIYLPIGWGFMIRFALFCRVSSQRRNLHASSFLLSCPPSYPSLGGKSPAAAATLLCELYAQYGVMRGLLLFFPPLCFVGGLFPEVHGLRMIEVQCVPHQWNCIKWYFSAVHTVYGDWNTYFTRDRFTGFHLSWVKLWTDEIVF